MARLGRRARPRPPPLQIDTIEHEDGWKTLRTEWQWEPIASDMQEFWFDCAKIILNDIGDCRMGADFLTRKGEQTIRAADVCDFAGEIGGRKILRLGKNREGKYESRLTYRKHKV